VEIPVHYGGADGADLAEVAREAGLTEERVIELHAGATYRVAFLGFTAGFPYLSGLPETLFVARLPNPRRLVPAGSVAIAGGHAGIYPQATPGGWRLLGRTPLRLFRPEADPITLLRMGDRVRFVPQPAP
jgi:inhibitor of KinA